MQVSARLLFRHKLLILIGLSMLILVTGISTAVWYSFQKAEFQISREGKRIFSKKVEFFLKNQVKERAQTLELQFNKVKSIIAYNNNLLSRSKLTNKGVRSILSELYKSIGIKETKLFYYSKKLGYISYPDHSTLQSNSLLKEIKFIQKNRQNELIVKIRNEKTGNKIDFIQLLENNFRYPTFLGIRISISRVMSNFDQRSPDRGSYSFLIDNQKNLISAPPHGKLELIPNSIDLSLNNINLIYKDKKLNSIFNEMALGSSDILKIRLNNDEKYLAFTPINFLELRLGIIVPSSMAMSDTELFEQIIRKNMKQAIIRIVIGSIIIIIISTCFAILLIRQILIPLEEVSKISSNMAEGNFDKRVNIKSSDEIGKLANVFNKMADQIQSLILHLKQRANELEELNQSLEEKVKDRTIELKKTNQELENLSITDELTKLKNRRYFDMELEKEWSRAKREKEYLSLILFDVDHFKKYNDHYGHQLGDACLQKVGKVIREALKRQTDVAARYGGEEFVVLLPNTKKIGAIKIAEEIRYSIEKLKIPHEKSKTHNVVTISLGIFSLIPKKNQMCDYLIRCADLALYSAKRNGRNKAVFYKRIMQS